MVLEIDFNSSQAIYIQLRNQIIIGIACDEYSEGESLPSVRQMASVLGVNMHTVNKAYAMLREEGYLKLDRRSGAVICVATETKRKEMDMIREHLRMLAAQAVCKGISREEMHQLVDESYGEIEE